MIIDKRKLKRIFITSVLYFFVYTVQIVLIHRFLNPIVTPLMIIRSVESLGKTGSFGAIHKSWKSLDEISPNMVNAVMASEDQIFLDHHGFDWEGIRRAMRHNKNRNTKLRGGSTISQQTAKNVFLWPSRTWIRKGAEVYFTCLIELLWSKERIMEVYLNVIETGDGVYGSEAAAQKYYRKSAARLSKNEAASIAAILPLPMKWSPKKPNTVVQKRTAWIIDNMGKVANPEWNVRKKSK